MATQLGKLVKNRRKELELGLRQLARRIEKSPSFIAMLENDDSPVTASEQTLRSIARELDLDPDEIITLAGKTPEEVVPSDALEVALFRHVKQMSRKKKKNLLSELGNS